MGKRFHIGNVFQNLPAGEILESQTEPISIKNNLAAECDKQEQQDQTAAAASAGCTPSKPKSILKPVEQDIQHKKLK
jgi:hypothetical protein